MTDPNNQPTPAGQVVPAQTQSPDVISSVVARYGRNELLISLGALIVILDDLVFDIFGDYSFSTVTWAASAVALALIVLKRWLPEVLARHQAAILILVVGVAVVVTIRDALLDLTFIPGRNLDVTFFLGMVGLYAGVVIMAVGAFGLWRATR